MDFFDQVPQVEHATSEGPCALPIFYRDASQIGVFFRVDVEKAAALLGPASSLEPWPVFGRALAAIYAWEYRDSTVGAYGEVGLGIQTRRRGTRPSLLRLVWDMGAQDDQGIWVVQLPVTTPAARAAGVELWGYPKYVTSIATRFDREEASVLLGDELRVSVGRLRGPKLAAQPVVTYTELHGRLLRTRIDVDHRVQWSGGSAGRVDVLGDGPTSRAFRALGLEGARPVLAFRVDRFRARLPAGVDLA